MGRSLLPSDAGVGVQPDDQPVAGRPGLLQQCDMALVQQVEEPVGETDPPAPVTPAFSRGNSRNSASNAS